MHAEVDNEEGSTICLYKSMLYKMYGIMHNLRSNAGKHQKNQSVKHLISITSTAYLK